MKLRFLLLYLLIPVMSFAQPLHEPAELFDKMMKGIEEVRTASYVLNLEERVFDKIHDCGYIIKLQVNPMKIYTYCVNPNPGAEALYVENTNSNKILINPNRFPYINLSLSVNSMLLRKNHQYTMVQLGFDYLHDILNNYIKIQKQDFFRRLTVKENIIYEKKEYYVLEIDNPDFGYINYKVQAGENIISIAKKFLVNDHMILELNKDISDYDNVSPGQVITIPNSFAKQIKFYIDKTNFLPLVQIIYDDKGFYTKIEFLVKDFKLTKLTLEPLP